MYAPGWFDAVNNIGLHYLALNFRQPIKCLTTHLDHPLQPENAHYLERACKEADTFRKKHGEEAPDRKALSEELPFLYACIKESGRLYPSVGGTIRHLE